MVLEEIVCVALQRPPCVVAFSGGRDSSAILALAAYCARRDGLPLPIPATHRFAGKSGTAESAWQEQVVRHLALDDWIVRRWTDELDVLGPFARVLLRRWGPLYPHNAHFIVPLLDDARGGCLLTGFGADEIFGAISGIRALVRTVRSRRLRATAFNCLGPMPERLRVRLTARRMPSLPWLTAKANEVLRRERARDQTDVRYRWSEVVRAWHDSPARLSSRRTDDALEALYGATIISPFESSVFLESLAGDRRWLGYPGRDRIMAELFGDLLPKATVYRASKAYFNEIFFSDHSRAFTQNWDGSHLDRTLALEAPLRHAWAQPIVDARTMSLLQQLWCDSQP